MVTDNKFQKVKCCNTCCCKEGGEDETNSN